MPRVDELGIEDVEEVLSEYFDLDFRVRGREASFLCPVHEDNHPSARCNTETGIWGCWSCQASGDLIDLGIATLIEDGILMGQPKTKAQRRKRKEQREQIQKLLIPDTPDAQLAKIRSKVRKTRKEIEHIVKRNHDVVIDVPPLGSYEDGPLDSLYARGFTRDSLKRWNVRFVTSARLTREDGTDFEITNSIAVPIVESDGETVIGWMYRSTPQSESWQPRYLYTPQIQLSEIWFGLDHVAGQDEITVTEGALDAMWLDQHGYPSLAILGSNVKSSRKLRKLANHKRVCMFPDRDTAGLVWSRKMGSSLQSLGVGVTVVQTASWMHGPTGEPAKDANDLCSLDLELVRELAVPYQFWKTRN